jgi:hypothetical protein
VIPKMKSLRFTVYPPTVTPPPPHPPASVLSQKEEVKRRIAGEVYIMLYTVKMCILAVYVCIYTLLSYHKNANLLAKIVHMYTYAVLQFSQLHDLIVISLIP